LGRIRKLHISCVVGPVFLFLAVSSHSQEKTSLYNRLLELSAATTEWVQRGEALKCGTPLVFALRAQVEGEAISSAVQGRVFSRPARQKSRLSPSGSFRVHYDTTGVDAPAMVDPHDMRPIAGTHEQYVDSVMAIAEFSLWYLTSVLKFDPPPGDGMLGGGPEYDIYIENLGPEGFGVTFWEEPFATTPNQKFSTYIVIDNDFYGNRTAGMDGLRVTVAHELHHAIQVGSYGVWANVPGSDFHFYETTSTWIESIVFPSIYDFLFEARKYFTQFRDSQGRSLSLVYYPSRFADPFYPGYERIVWAQYLEARFGRAVIRTIWERMKSKPYLRSLREIMWEAGSTIESEVARFSVWNYYTADRADSLRSYPKGSLYLRFEPNALAVLTGGRATISSAAYPLSTQMVAVQMPTDTVTAVVANVNAGAAQSSSVSLEPMSITVSSTGVMESYQFLRTGVAASFVADQNHLWRVVYLTSSTNEVATDNTYPAPNPFRLNGSSDLLIPVSGGAEKDIEVSIYSISMDLLFSQTYRGRSYFGREEVAIPVHDLLSHVSSGVHFLVMNIDGRTRWWKVAFVK
jgi:hypothetical protein